MADDPTEWVKLNKTAKYKCKRGYFFTEDFNQMFWEFQCLATGFFEDFAPWKQCVLPTGKITQEEIHKLAQKLSNFQQTKSVRILLNLTGMGVNMIGI